MKETVLFLVNNLVENKNAVRVEEEKTDDQLFLHVFVSKNDLGRVVGKGGKMANSIRTIMRALGNHNNVRVSVKFDTAEE